MKRRISTVEVVTGLVFTLFAGVAIVTLSYGYSFADALLIQPAVTQTMAQKAVGDGWSLSESCRHTDSFHRYIFVRNGERKDVNCRLGEDGKWATDISTINY